MATGGLDREVDLEWSSNDDENIVQQNEEILACQSYFDGEGERRFKIISNRASAKGIRNFLTVELLVPVRQPRNEIVVNIVIQEEKSNSNNKEETIIGTHPLKFLSPIKLTVTLPHGYPSDAPPVFALSCVWLSGDQLNSVCSQLDVLWKEYMAMPILLTWIDWIENNIFSYLDIEDKLNIPITCDNNNDVDKRVHIEHDSIEDVMDTLFRYNENEEAIDFTQHDQECSICFIEKSGRDFYRFLPCKHYFCKDCVTEFCYVHVNDGTVQELRCLESKCTTEIRPSIIKESVDKDAYERWERLTLQKGLDLMGDIIYCPRCQMAVVREENTLNLGHCLNCQFSFCMECSEPVHPGDQCFFKKEEPTEVRTDKKQDIFEELRKKIIKKAEIQSRTYINEKTKTCPHCKVRVIKISGCNSVVCTQCTHAMCWACNEDITQAGYRHFSESPKCRLYRIDIQEDPPSPVRQAPMEVQLLSMAEAEGKDYPEFNIVQCPLCHEDNVRKNNENLVICWNCNSNFCFLCKKKLSPPYSRHFIKTKCKTHSFT